MTLLTKIMKLSRSSNEDTVLIKELLVTLFKKMFLEQVVRMSGLFVPPPPLTVDIFYRYWTLP